MSFPSNEKKVAYFYTFLLMILFTIPVYFTLSYAFENELVVKQMRLENYANELEKNIHSEKIGFARSVKVKFALFNKEQKAQIYNLSKKLNNYEFKIYKSYPYLYYRKDIGNNIYNISYIICEIRLDYSKILLLATILFFIILINIYILNKSIIKNISKPYEVMQKYTNILFNDTMHELKTPLGIININLDLLSRKTGSSKHIQRMKIALKQIQINYESIEYYIKNKRVTYPKDKINLSSYLSSRIEFFEDIANSKFININVYIQDNIFIFMNVLELQRIVDNTLINAIKYSKPNSKIDITLISTLDKCSLAIKDYGCGIKDVKNVFKRFSREDETQGGFGLGLNIIKNICDKNNIVIELKSKEDEGSKFTYFFELYKIKFLDRIEDEK
ncbi:two-component sensor histidine kinase [Arcobacter sp. CECT 8986]|uniref:sensor histidine kinase n=1 Tax=Arcobacter sp. CECT 8986 TaxID=2044507 RepID=UPI001009E6D4|nr:HAMP domain-containing sensor histidine kinase [Arcobacter sp. CECT 8986]RXK00387.1 two-component sensor histidine kinase [Arcobacter sp. CECT 8986]